MYFPRCLLLLSIAAGALAIMADVFDSRQESLKYDLAASTALVAYIAIAGRSTAPRLRWALTVGFGLLTLGVALRLSRYSTQPDSFGWSVYDPLNDTLTVFLDRWRRALDREWIADVVRLLGLLCLASGLLALPRRRGTKQVWLTTIVAVVLVSVVALTVLNRLDDAPVLDLLGIVWPSLLAAVVAAGLVALAGRHGDRTWLLSAGALLLALAEVTAIDDITSTWLSWRTLAEVHNGVGVATTIAFLAEGSPDAFAGLETGVRLGGPILFAVGLCRTLRQLPP